MENSPQPRLGTEEQMLTELEELRAENKKLEHQMKLEATKNIWLTSALITAFIGITVPVLPGRGLLHAGVVRSLFC